MSKIKKSGKKLTSHQLQIAVLRHLLAQPKKRYTARQIIDMLNLENNKDAVEHALRQLVMAGSAAEHLDKKFSVALQHLMIEDEPETVEIQAVKPKKENFRKVKSVVVDDFSEDKITDFLDAEIESEPPEFEKPFQKKKKTADDFPAKKQSAEPARHEKTLRKSTSNNPKIIEGRMDATRTGTGYVVTEQLDEDIFIGNRQMNGALNGDTVTVKLFPKVVRRRRGREDFMPKQEGEVVGIVKRAVEHFIGTFRLSRKYGVFLPDNPNMPTDIYVPLDATKNARDGDKVVVQITDWQEGNSQMPIGKVNTVLGKIGGNDFEMKKILIGQGFDLEHSDEAMAEAGKIPDKISPQEIQLRRDFRDILTFTIDPEDAKDFDDALSIRELENGNLEIGVHIADVTHYLKPDSSMDKEAFQRSTSVYLVDRVCPMLPEKLSNNLCSLVPHEDRLTFSAVFIFDKNDKILGRWFGKTVIHSAHRFAYETAQTVLENKPSGELAGLEIFPKLDWALKTLNQLSKKMRAEREKNGSIGFETEEVRFRLDADGSPIEAFVKERKDAHLLIEDFMLLANKEVAFFMDSKSEHTSEVPFIYRVHDLPDMDKVAEFARFANEMGVKLKIDTPKQIAKSFNELMYATKKDERLKLLEPLAIRTMAKAIYTSKNIGHYGLGFTHYTHFTSPIRRFSDVLCHRILEKNLGSGIYRMDKSKLEEMCKHISTQEKKAADAERESIKYKQAEFTKRQIGQTLTGIISGMIERGFFVELPGSKAEGMIAFRDLADTYNLMEGNLRAKGTRWGRIFKMGDRVQVKVWAVDLQKRQIELELAEEER